MGALHPGHLSLISKAKEQNDLVVCSIFVNPTQFNDPKDFELYPKTIEKDIASLEQENCNILFLPEKDQIYPEGFGFDDKFAIGELEFILEGKYRPGHFRGVCMVMKQLMNIIMPDRLYLGQKDFQQCLVIRKLLSSLHFNTETVICPIKREEDGLAMSSRNVRLSVAERKKATAIFKALSFIGENIRPGSTSFLLDKAQQILIHNDFKVDYVEIAEVDSLHSVSVWDGRSKVVALIAAYMGNVRLIDNMILPLNFATNAN